jgi:hypothetical protein
MGVMDQSTAGILYFFVGEIWRYTLQILVFAENLFDEVTDALP